MKCEPEECTKATKQMILYEFRVVALDNFLRVFFRRLQKVQQVGADVCVDGA